MAFSGQEGMLPLPLLVGVAEEHFELLVRDDAVPGEIATPVALVKLRNRAPVLEMRTDGGRVGFSIGDDVEVYQVAHLPHQGQRVALNKLILDDDICGAEGPPQLMLVCPIGRHGKLESQVVCLPWSRSHTT